jgi:hypothetical protein
LDAAQVKRAKTWNLQVNCRSYFCVPSVPDAGVQGDTQEARNQFGLNPEFPVLIPNGTGPNIDLGRVEALQGDSLERWCQFVQASGAILIVVHAKLWWILLMQGTVAVVFKQWPT